MARANSRYSVKGTRFDDVITVGETQVQVNSAFKTPPAGAIAAGLVINADSGNDTVIGGRGSDEINGGRGNDTLIGGDGFDRLLGGDGDDTLIDLDVLEVDSDTSVEPDAAMLNAKLGAFFDGGRGIDTIDFTGSTQSLWIDLWGSINATVDYVAGPDGTGDWDYDNSQWLTGRIANVENIIGGDGDDRLWGNFADNEIHGGAGNDELNGGAISSANPSHDKLFGDAGNDYLHGGNGNDELTGGTGIDRFIFGNTDPDGQDIVWDYTQNEDYLSFVYEAPPINWAPTTYAGVASLIGSYEGGAASIIVVGIEDPAQLRIETNFIF